MQELNFRHGRGVIAVKHCPNLLNFFVSLHDFGHLNYDRHVNEQQEIVQIAACNLNVEIHTPKWDFRYHRLLEKPLCVSD